MQMLVLSIEMSVMLVRAPMRALVGQKTDVAYATMILPAAAETFARADNA